MDLALGTDFALSMSGYDLATETGLRTAVMVSLFTDRRAHDDDVIPDGTGDRRGWWADAWPEVPRDRIGSRLWLLSREKQATDVLDRARTYALEALQWLVDDGIAAAVNAEAMWVRGGLLGLRVSVTLADRTRWEDVINYPLERA